MYVDKYTTLTVLALTGGCIYIYDIGRLRVKLFGPNFLINGSVRYFFWPRDAVKNF